MGVATGRSFGYFALAGIAAFWLTLSSPLAHATDISDEPFIGLDLGTITPVLRERFKITWTGTGNRFRSPPTKFSTVVTAVHPGGQAEAAGFQPGDVVLSVGAYLGGSPIVQPSYPESGPTSDFQDPTIEDLVLLLQSGLDAGAFDQMWGLHRPSSPGRPIYIHLSYPKGYGQTTPQSDRHKQWLAQHKAEGDRKREAEVRPAPPAVPPREAPTKNAAPDDKGTLMVPKEIQAVLFTGRTLISSNAANEQKQFRWQFTADGWWARETIDKSKGQIGGRWRLSGDGFCITPYGYLLGNPTTPNGPEYCGTVRALGGDKWMFVGTNAGDVSIWTTEVSASAGALFPDANPEWIAAWKNEQPVRAFQGNAGASPPAFADGFIDYILENERDLISRARSDITAAVTREQSYKWIYPAKYASPREYRAGDSCVVRTIATINPNGYASIARRFDSDKDCSTRGVHVSVGNASFNGTNAEYDIRPENLTASLRENVIDDTVPANLATACDLICRGAAKCVRGPTMESVIASIWTGQTVRRVGHAYTDRTTYVGSKAVAAELCAIVNSLQSKLDPIHVRYARSLELDRAKRGACGEITYSNYPWFGSGTAAQRATIEQLHVSEESCVEKSHMENSFPFQGATRGDLIVTLRFPVGKWPSCFTDLPLHSPSECAKEAVAIGGSRTVRAAIVY
jgi:hypothetical protein